MTDLKPKHSADKPPSTYFVSRHQGSIDWVKSQPIKIDHFFTHLTKSKMLKAGDTVIGTLPVNIAADLNNRGVRYMYLELDFNESRKEKELNQRCVSQADPRLNEYLIWRIDQTSAAQV